MSRERALRQIKMIERQESSLLTEMERVKSLMKLTPEERKKEVRRQMYVELKAMEMERRQRVALETVEKCERDREEREQATESLRQREERVRQEAEQREEEERKANEQKALEKKAQHQLKEERLQWKKVMLVEEELVKRPRCISALKKEQQRRREEAEFCRLPRVGDKAGPERLTSDLKAEQQSKKKTLYNNWVGEQNPDSEPVTEKLHPNSSTYLLFAAKPGPKSAEKPKTPEPTETLPWLQERLKVGYCVNKYWVYRERKNEKRTLKAEEQYARWTAFKASCATSFSHQSACYPETLATNRNSILKSTF